MQDSFRKSTLTLPLLPTLVAQAAAATYIAQRPSRIVGAQLCLSGLGTGAGATTVNVNVNGTPINPGGSLSIAVGAAANAVNTPISLDSQYPGGFRVNKGDVITVDIAAVPGTTVPKLAFVVLDLVEIDV
jgi:hypothetical protein